MRLKLRLPTYDHTSRMYCYSVGVSYTPGTPVVYGADPEVGIWVIPRQPGWIALDFFHYRVHLRW